jgi:hypothetical protein
MGCDIHFYVEVKRNGRWTYHPVEEKYEAGGRESDFQDWARDPLFVDRNYELFAILADVRNDERSRGTNAGDAYVPIAPPRDLPEDLTAEVRAKAEAMEGDAHSHSWLLLSELRAYDWGRSANRRGWVEPWQFEVWRRQGKPVSWYGDAGGPNSRVSNAEMARLIDSGDLEWLDSGPTLSGSRRYRIKEPTASGGHSFFSRLMKYLWHGSSGRRFTQVEWSERYSDSVKGFVEETIPALEALGAPEEVRIVFWFDN